MFLMQFHWGGGKKRVSRSGQTYGCSKLCKITFETKSHKTEGQGAGGGGEKRRSLEEKGASSIQGGGGETETEEPPGKKSRINKDLRHRAIHVFPVPAISCCFCLHVLH